MHSIRRTAFLGSLLLATSGLSDAATTKFKKESKPAVQAPKPVTPMVAPPRSVTDITAILQKQKPDPARIASLIAQADASPPPSLAGLNLSEFYYARAQSALAIGRLQQAVADAELAIKHGKSGDYDRYLSRIEQFQVKRLHELGDYASPSYSSEGG